MRAIAKENLGYDEYPYTNWIKGNEYQCEFKDNDKRADLVDEKGITFHFVGNARKYLSKTFDFKQ